MTRRKRDAQPTADNVFDLVSDVCECPFDRMTVRISTPGFDEPPHHGLSALSCDRHAGEIAWLVDQVYGGHDTARRVPVEPTLFEDPSISPVAKEAST